MKVGFEGSLMQFHEASVDGDGIHFVLQFRAPERVDGQCTYKCSNCKELRSRQELPSERF